MEDAAEEERRVLVQGRWRLHKQLRKNCNVVSLTR